MAAKIRNVLAAVFLSCLIITLFTVSLTYGRYWKETESESGNSSDITYSVSGQIEVSNVDELIAAVSNGYSYVKMADEMVNPLVVTTAVTDVGSDLILDLNGHDIQRNSREPMMNIPEGVRMTIIDSSEAQDGSFYNPVGSVLKISGGILTVTSGIFESGPRTTEYYSYTASPGDKGRKGGSVDGVKSMTVYTRNDGAGSYAETTATVPVIKPTVVSTGTVTTDGVDNTYYYANGNIYFDKEYSYGGDTVVPADTFLYYSPDDKTVTSAAIDIFAQGSADFYYTYWTAKTETDGGLSYDGAYATETDAAAKGEAIEVTVYGYYNDIDTAENMTDIDKYAAIKMESGSLYVRGGDYTSYFGISSAYCVYAAGGFLSVEEGAFRTIDEGVCIRCSYVEDHSKSEYLYVTGGEFASEIGDTIQVKNGNMIVEKGNFTKDVSASANDKDATNGAAINLAGSGSRLDIKGTEGTDGDSVLFNIVGSGAIGILCQDSAKIDAQNAVFTVAGSTVDGTIVREWKNNIGIYNVLGTVTVSSCEFHIDSDSSAGILSNSELLVNGGDTALSDGSGATPDTSDTLVAVSDTVFYMGGDDSKGIYQQCGTVSVSSGIFSMTGEKAIGIIASQGVVNIGTKPSVGEAYTLQNTVVFYIDHIADCYGVLAGLNRGDENWSGTTNEDAEVTINLHSAQFFIGQGSDESGSYYCETENDEKLSGGVNCAGIFSDLKNATVNVGRGIYLVAGSYGAGIYAKQGNVNSLTERDLSNKLVVFVGVRYSNYVNGGYAGQSKTDWIYSSADESFYRQGATFTGLDDVTSAGSYGVAALGGTIKLESVYVYLKSNSASGLFSTGGNLEITRLEADIFDGNASYLSTSAVSVQGGHVTLRSCNLATSGIGITVENGNLVFEGLVLRDENGNESVEKPFSDGTGTETYNVLINATRTTAIYVEGGSLEFKEKSVAKVSSTIATGSDQTYNALPWMYYTAEGKEAYAYHSDGIQIAGGSLQSDGELTVIHTGSIQNDTSYDSILDYQTKGYAIRVTGSANSSATEVKIALVQVSSSCGGGVYVSGGSLTLGSSDTAQGDIRVETTGYDSDGKAYSESGGENFPEMWNSGNWNYVKSLTGGSAVEVNGGTLTIYGGSYIAAFGDGILVKNGTATVYSGTFEGYNPTAGAGPAASYGMKVFGGTLYVYGGTFGGTAGSAGGRKNPNGACVRGIKGETDKTTGTTSPDIWAYAYIYGGVFSTTGNAAFCIFDRATVEFGKKDGSGSNDDILVSGGTAGITLERTNGGNSTVTIFNGVFRSSNLVSSAYNNGIYCQHATGIINVNGGLLLGTGNRAIYTLSQNGQQAAITVNKGVLIGYVGSYYGTVTYGGSASTSTGVAAATIQSRYGIASNSLLGSYTVTSVT